MRRDASGGGCARLGVEPTGCGRGEAPVGGGMRGDPRHQRGDGGSCRRSDEVRCHAQRAQLAVRVMRARTSLFDVDCGDRAVGALRKRSARDDEQLHHHHQGGGDAHGGGEPECSQGCTHPRRE